MRKLFLQFMTALLLPPLNLTCDGVYALFITENNLGSGKLFLVNNEGTILWKYNSGNDPNYVFQEFDYSRIELL